MKDLQGVVRRGKNPKMDEFLNRINGSPRYNTFNLKFKLAPGDVDHDTIMLRPGEAGRAQALPESQWSHDK
jgi:hypothetical protein